MRISGRLAACGVLVALAACGDDTPSGGTTSSGTSPSGGGGTGGADAPHVELPLAVGISVDRVELNQAVGVAIVEDGTPVAETERQAPLIEGRPGLLRVFWELAPGFEPREIEAHVVLEGTSPRTLVQRKPIDGPPGFPSADESFAWALGPADLVGVTSYSVSLHDVTKGPEQPTAGQRIPAQGTTPLGLVTDSMTLAVVVVPASLSCASSTFATIGDYERAVIETQLESLFPIRELDVSYHEPHPLAVSNCADPGAILAEVSALREAEGLGGEYYYHAILPNADEVILGIGGYAWIESDAPGADRVSFSVNWWGEATEVLNNLTHEIGHNHGRTHSFEDPAYEPSGFEQSQCGRRDGWGYGAFMGPHAQGSYFPDFAPLQNLQGWLVPPTDELGGDITACEGFGDPSVGPAMNDLMGYASPYWVGAYTYARLAARVRAINGWAMGGGAGPTGDSSTDDSYALDRSVHLYASDDGPIWQVHRGALHAADGGTSFAMLFDRAGDQARLPIVSKVDGEGLTKGYAFTLPRGASLASVDAIELFDRGRSIARLSGTGLDRLRGAAQRLK